MPLHPLFRLAGGALSPAGEKARLSILIYHRVLPEPDPIFPGEATTASFDAQMGDVKQVFNVLPLAEAVTRLAAGTLPARAACITFDDGYADNLIHALPILQKHGLHATFFVATAYLNGGRMFNDTIIEAVRRTGAARVDLEDFGLGSHPLATWDDKRAAIGHILPKVKYLPLGEREAVAQRVSDRLTDQPLPDDLMMTTGQLQALHGAGMEIGGHTDRHPILAKLDRDAARDEIVAGKAWLESRLGSPVRLFAYPNGKPGEDYLPEQSQIPRELGLLAAVSTQWGVAGRDSDLFQLPRFTPWARGPARFMAQMLGNLRHVSPAA